MTKGKGISNTHPCGCTNAPDPASGVLRSVSKCRTHRAQARDPATLDARYYAELGVLDAAGRLRATAHVAELVEALGELPKPKPWGAALEVGCGASPYVGAIRAAGWTYYGLDASPFAARWTARFWAATTLAMDLGEYEAVSVVEFGLILCAHAFEHMADAPGAIRKCAGMLGPGGELWVVVPDDSDPINPDHLWMFDRETLGSCLESAGLQIVKISIRRYVKHESFIYARARKAD
jgi:SAM-dependent methyltransferase